MINAICIRQILSLSKVIPITLARLSSVHSADGAIMKPLSRDTFPCLAWRFHHQKGHFSTVISYFPFPSSFPPHFIYPVILTQGSLQYTLGHFLSDTENLNLGLNKSYCFVHCLEKMTNRKSCVTTFACFDSIFLKTLGSVFFFFFNNILIIPFVFRKYTSQYNPTVYFCFVHDSLQ